MAIILLIINEIEFHSNKKLLKHNPFNKIITKQHPIYIKNDILDIKIKDKSKRLLLRLVKKLENKNSFLQKNLMLKFEKKFHLEDIQLTQFIN